MTYSRPSTSKVNALFDPVKPSPMKGMDRFRVQSVQAAQIMDNRNPTIEGNNAGQFGKEVSTFIGELFSPEIKQFAIDQIENNAKNQVGKILQTEDPIDLMRATAPEQQATLRQLSPYARWVLESRAAEKASSIYATTLPAEYAKRDAQIYGDNLDPQAQARAESEAKLAASEKAGLSVLSPRMLQNIAPQLMQLEGKVQGLAENQRTLIQDQNERVIYRGGLKSDWTGLTAARINAAQKGPEAVAAYGAGLKKSLEALLVRDSGRYLPKDQAEELNTAVIEEVARLKTLNRYSEAKNLLQTLQSAAALGVKNPGTEVDFFSQRLQNGTTLSYNISKLQQEVAAGEEQWQKDEALRTIGPALRAGAQGDPNARAQFQSLAAQIESPQAYLGALQSFSAAENFGQSPSEAQLLAEADIRYQLGQDGADRQSLWRKATQSGLTAGQLRSLATSMADKDGVTDDMRLIANGRTYQKSEFAADSAEISRALGATRRPDQQRIENDLTNTVSLNTEKRLTELRAKVAAGETKVENWTETTNAILREEREKAKNSMIAAVKDGSSKYVTETPEGRAASELQTLRDNIKKSNGVVSVESFPQATRDAFKVQYPGKELTVRELTNFQAARISGVKGPNNKAVYPNPGQTLRQTMYQATQGTENPQRRIGAKWTFDYKPPSLPGRSNAEVEAERSGQPQKQGDQASANPIQQFLTASLNSVANTVLGGPAQAATLDNPDAIQTLSKVWAKQEPLDMRAPALPQVAAATPTRSPALAITSDMHPMFVAIGIAEGTRTPNGGKTKAYSGHRDPGNGAWNVGTVSGQQGGTPASSDKRWMSTLTTVSAQVAPVLQRMGLKPNTQGWNRVMFNILDLRVQAPAAVTTFISKLPQASQSGFSVEALAKARSDSFFIPGTSRLDAPGFGNSYSRLFRDQRSRAGVWDYRRRL